MRRPPRPCVPGWPSAYWPALLHELGGAAVRVNPGSADRRQFVQILDVRARRAVDAYKLGVLRLDDVVFVRRVRAVAVAQAEVAGRQLQRVSGKYVTGPGPGIARPHYRVDASALVDGQ